MHILLPSDVFPPGSVGGAAWSAYTLALALQQQQHSVTAVVPTRHGPTSSASMPPSDVPTLRYHYPAPRIPFVQNYYRHERLWPQLAELLVTLAQPLQQPGLPPLLIHAQHAQTTPAAVLAGRRLGVPVVATVRDHWPWDYFATGLHGNRIPAPPQPTLTRQVAALASDLPARMGALRGTLALPALPYMLGHVQRRAALLARADAVIAVSHYIAQRLAPLVPAARLHVIPNMVDLASVERSAAQPPETPLPARFLLFIGKLEANKGAGLLPAVLRALFDLADQADQTDQTDQGFTAAQLPPLLIAGTGALRPQLARELDRLGIAVHWLDWVSHEEILRLLARCTVLLFPSVWGEPLSRVLLEGSALGAPIVAMPTGGTPDIIRHGENGLLAATPQQFATQLAQLLRDEAQRRHLSAQAREQARQRFSVEAVLPRVLRLYSDLLEPRVARP
jgi:glycosyltransferase involved in cell wall biosynthesis